MAYEQLGLELLNLLARAGRYRLAEHGKLVGPSVRRRRTADLAEGPGDQAARVDGSDPR